MENTLTYTINKIYAFLLCWRSDKGDYYLVEKWIDIDDIW